MKNKYKYVLPHTNKHFIHHIISFDRSSFYKKIKNYTNQMDLRAKVKGQGGWMVRSYLEDFDDKDEGLDEDLDEDPDEDLDEGYGNSVEAYAKYEGFADLYEGQDNENDDEGQAEGDDTCKPFSDIQDCKEIKGKSGPIKKLRRACKTCKK